MDYIITDYGIKDDGKVYTKEIQRIIDMMCIGDTLIIPEGTFKTGALFFRKPLSIIIEGMLVGSDDISDYPILKTRIEGETCEYYSALLNIEDVSSFMLEGSGIIDGNGEKVWKAFWELRKIKPECTNKEIPRARLLYVANSKNVTLKNVHFQNSQFWTTHFYKCSKLLIEGVNFKSPCGPLKAPSTDAIDLDVCQDVLIKNCYFAVNDDAIALKGGKGINAHLDQDNGTNEDITIMNCQFGFCHSILTCGSEAIHNKHISVRDCLVEGASNLLWLKMRPDTLQKYEDIMIDNITGVFNSLLTIHPWTQFVKEQELLKSEATNIEFRNLYVLCDTYMDYELSDEYELHNILVKDCYIKAGKDEVHPNLPSWLKEDNVEVEIVSDVPKIKASNKAD